MKAIKQRDKTRKTFKIGIGIIVPLVVGACLLFSGSIAASSWLQDRQRQALEADIARLSGAAKVQTQFTAAPQEKLKEAKERLERASNFFPAELKASTALEAVLLVASQSDVKVINLQEKIPSRYVIGEHVYYSHPFTLRAEGTVEHLIDLVYRLEQLEGTPLVFQRVSLNKNKEFYEASLDITLYSRSRTETVPKLQKPEKGKESNAKK